jgi:hypothetical protein
MDSMDSTTGPSKVFTALRIQPVKSRVPVLQTAIRNYLDLATGRLLSLVVVLDVGTQAYYDLVANVLGDRVSYGAVIHSEQYLPPPLDRLQDDHVRQVAAVQAALAEATEERLRVFGWTGVQWGLRWDPGWRVVDLPYAERVEHVGAPVLLAELAAQLDAVRDLGPQLRGAVMAKLGGLAAVSGLGQRDLLLGEVPGEALGEELGEELVNRRATLAAAAARHDERNVVMAWSPAMAYAVDELLAGSWIRPQGTTWLTVGELDPVEETVSALQRACTGVD